MNTYTLKVNVPIFNLEFKAKNRKSAQELAHSEFIKFACMTTDIELYKKKKGAN